MKIAVSGATGRMGRRIVELAREARDIEVVATLGRAAALEVPCDCLIDFSVPEGTARRVEECRARGVALVVGTTGLPRDLERALDEVARVIPVLVASNTSLGVNLLLSLAALTAGALPDEFEIEVVETHHHAKRDAPSGTALSLVRAMASRRSLDPVRDVVHGRSGDVGPRPARQIGVHAVRAGDVVGEHVVLFAGPGERIELVHKASSRDVFARGALSAARFLAGKPPRRYSMADVIARA